MFKNISSLGTTLNKTEQKSINGGYGGDILPDVNCQFLPVDPCDNGYHRDENCVCVWGTL